MKVCLRALTGLLILSMLAGLFCGCEQKTEPPAAVQPQDAAPTAAPTPTQEPERYPRAETLAAATGKISGAFSPFFDGLEGDAEVCALTQLRLVEHDRLGEPVLLGISGETRVCGAQSDTYTGPADIVVTPQEDGRVFYDITLREDLTFSDGVPVTIDDVIFTMYVLSDPTYDGSNEFSLCPIEGMEEYWSDRIPLYVLLLYTGKENRNYKYWTQAQQAAFWTEALPAAGEAYASAAVEYCVQEGYNTAGDSVAACAAHWGYVLEEDATAADFFQVLKGWYDEDYLSIANCLRIDVNLWQLLDSSYKVGIPAGESVPRISGIQRTGDYSLRLVATKYDPDMIYRLELPIAPLHYYGSESSYDWANDCFGFEKGDLTAVREKTGQVLGAGPYRYLETCEGVVYMEAVSSYYKGEPARKYLSLQRMDGVESINAVAEGRLDISRPVECKAAEEAIAAGGDAITVSYQAHAGYGYIGINASNVKVGSDPASDASRLLRRGIFTVLAAYRAQYIAEYYGSGAHVIDYPISTATWLAPLPGETEQPGFYELDVHGEPIYTEDMSQAERRKAAVDAALDFFAAAGYTVADGVLTAAPDGAALQYEIHYVAGSPCAQMIQDASLALFRVGLTLHLEEIEEPAALSAYSSSGSAELWCGAWDHSVEPELQYQYHSQGPGNVFGIADNALDALLEELPDVMDRASRRSLYLQAMELVQAQCVELPIYQRTEVYAVSSQRVSTVPEGLTSFYTWQREVERIQ